MAGFVLVKMIRFTLFEPGSKLAYGEQSILTSDPIYTPTPEVSVQLAADLPQDESHNHDIVDYGACRRAVPEPGKHGR